MLLSCCQLNFSLGILVSVMVNDLGKRNIVGRSFLAWCQTKFNLVNENSTFISQVGWDCKIHRLHLYRVITPPHNESPKYDTQRRLMVRLQLWGIGSTSSLPLLPGSLLTEVVVPDRVLSMGQIELFDHLIVCKQITDVKLN